MAPTATEAGDVAPRPWWLKSFTVGWLGALQEGFSPDRLPKFATAPTGLSRLKPLLQEHGD